MELQQLLDEGDLGDGANLFMMFTQGLPGPIGIGVALKEEFLFERAMFTHDGHNGLIIGVPKGSTNGIHSLTRASGDTQDV